MHVPCHRLITRCGIAAHLMLLGLNEAPPALGVWRPSPDPVLGCPH